MKLMEWRENAVSVGSGHDAVMLKQLEEDFLFVQKLEGFDSLLFGCWEAFVDGDHVPGVCFCAASFF